jgi:DNA-binding IclR family transcriptional regulator
MSTESSLTIKKAFMILQLFRDYRVMTVSVVAEELGLPRSTAHRILVSLRDVGVLEQVRGGHFVLSLELFELGALAPQRRALSDRVGFDVEALADRTGYRALIGVRRGLEVVYVESANGMVAQLQGVRTRIGFRAPLHATSMGQIFLAFGDEGLLARTSDKGLDAYTPKTITQIDPLRERCDTVREMGYALTVDEFVRATSSLAVPIHGPDDTVIAALAIVGNTDSIVRNQTRLVREAQMTAERIARGSGATYQYRVRGNQSVVAVA